MSEAPSFGLYFNGDAIIDFDSPEVRQYYRSGLIRERIFDMEGPLLQLPPPPPEDDTLVATTTDDDPGEPFVAGSVVVSPIAMSADISVRRIIRHLAILRMLDSPFVPVIRHMWPISDPTRFVGVVYETDRLEGSLHDLIQGGKLQEGDDTVRGFCYDLMRGLMYIHSAKFAHRDLSPKSCVIRETPRRLMITEFGLARPLAKESPILADEMLLSYRSPETLTCRLVLGYPQDLWAAGLIVAEMFTGFPLMDIGLHGDCDLGLQTQFLIRILGTPTTDQIEYIADSTAKAFVIRQPTFRRMVKAKLVVDAGKRKIPEDAQNLVDALLVWGAHARPSAIQCLKSPFFTDAVRNIETELESSVVLPPQFDFEVVRLKTPQETTDCLRRMVLDEVALYHLKVED